MSDSVGDRMVKATEPTRGKMFSWFGSGSKDSTSNWKPEPNDEQKAQMKREYDSGPKLGQKKKSKKATKKKSMALAKR